MMGLPIPGDWGISVHTYPVMVMHHPNGRLFCGCDTLIKFNYLFGSLYCEVCDTVYLVPIHSWWMGQYPTLAREFQCFRVWGKFVFRTLELTDTPTNLANQVKVGHALDQSRSVQSRGPESAHQNNEPSWRSSRADCRLSRQFWDD